MKRTVLYRSSIVAAVSSGVWVVLLVALAARIAVSDQPMPVLAKFTELRIHYMAIDGLFRAWPALALLSLVLAGVIWYSQRSVRAIRPPVIICAANVMLSLFVMIGNPGRYFSWFWD